LEQSNHLPNQKQGEVNKYDLIVLLQLFQDSSRALKAMQLCFFSGSQYSWSGCIHSIGLMNLTQGFQCRVFTYWALVEMLLLSRLKMVTNYFENRNFMQPTRGF
jgi:hypothetical protein